jgi:hypothetical protein
MTAVETVLQKPVTAASPAETPTQSGPLRVRFDNKDFLWRPRHAGISRQFECPRLTTAEAAIRTMPDFGKYSDASGQNRQTKQRGSR